MQIQTYEHAADFLSAASAFLLKNEATHNLLLGLAGELVHNPQLYGQEAPFFALVTDAGQPIGAALRTPPYMLSLGLFEAAKREAAMQSLAEFVFQRYPDLSGVAGPSESSDLFAIKWVKLTGRTATQNMALRIYQLNQVSAPVDVPGQLRPASAADRDLLIEWVMGFHRDAQVGDVSVERAAVAVSRWLESAGRSLFLWEVAGQPVSMAGVAGETAHGIRISAVYTPADLRNRGYASACVAALSQRMLDQGRRFCFLYTDLANPISNSIYQRIGYHAVCDVSEYNFDEG